MSITREESILKGLNKAQCRAVTSKANTVAILAGPGSGKTHTLTSRVVWLVDHVGYQPADVIVATFTVKAAREMKERIGKVLGNNRENKIILGTFHSIARRYLAAYGGRIGLNPKFGIADDSDSRALIQRICKRLQLSIDAPQARSWISKKKAKGSLGEEPAKPGQRKPAENPALETCYREYQAHLERSNLLDYDDLLTKCVELLRKCPSCVSNIQTVLIDEYQDTNGIQYELMRLFAQEKRRVTIVGDPDQSIYGWRSAETRNLYRMLRDYPGTEEVSLEENYRSSQSILNLSLQVIQQDTKRYQKVLLPVHNKGTRPVLRRLKSSATEADWIVSEIRRIQLVTGKMVGYDDIAILLRSASLSRHVESALGRAGIAYRMVGGFKFYERAEIKVLLDYLRVIYQPENNDAIARVINVPKRGIGEGTIKALLEEAELSKLSLWILISKHCRGDRMAKAHIKKQAEQKLSGELIRLVLSARKKIEEPLDGSPYNIVDLVEHLLEQLRFQKFLEDTYPEDHEGRWANVREFVGLTGDFMRDHGATDDEALPDIEGLNQVKENDPLGRFLANVSLASDAQTGGKDGTPSSLVTISTIHAAKGLEWPVVFIPAVYNGSIPHARSEDLDEERRLLYVAMTRAKSLLYLSCPLYSSQGGSEQVELSQFVSASTLSGQFAKRGPSFEKRVLDEISRILDRPVPSQEEVFKNMPNMFSPDDDIFPLDPLDPKHAASTFVMNNNKRDDQHGNRQKRQKTQYQSVDQDAQCNEVQGWKRDYATTMEQAFNFTVSSLPGFISAGAHQSAISAAAAAAFTEEQSMTEQTKVARRGTTKRPADQMSMLGFVTSGSKPAKSSSTVPLPNPPSHLSGRRTVMAANNGPRSLHHQRGQVSMPQVPPIIEPGLASHKLGGSAQPKTRPEKPKQDAGIPRKHYTCFSSSPSRLEQLGKELPADVAESTPPPPPEAQERPANCLHVTTLMAQNTMGGFRRPNGFKNDLVSLAPMERLRKPFKPLTINRSVGGGAAGPRRPMS
jgi:DNA helicase II / ATP-dependent DNA helicase PcrA